MLLRRLVDHQPEDDEAARPAFYADRPVRWQLDLRADGTVAGLVDLADPSDRARKNGETRTVPYVTRTSGIAPLPGADDLQYVLGWSDDSTKPDRVAGCHTAFVEAMTRWAAQAPEVPAARAVAAFYAGAGPSSVDQPAEWGSKQTAILAVAGRPVTDEPSLQRFWVAEVERGKGGGREGICLVCGRAAPLLKTLPQGLPRALVPGAGQANVALVSANKAIHTYDFSDSLTTVPICVVCGPAAVSHLRGLLADGDHSAVFGGDSRLCWWTLGSSTAAVGQVIRADDPDTIERLVARARTGHEPPTTGLARERFCALTIGGSGPRVAIRDWVDMPLVNLEASVGAWFADHATAGTHAEARRHFPLWQLVLAAGRWDRQARSYARLGARNAQRPPDVDRDLLRAALRRTHLPASLLPHLVTRVRTDGHVDGPRAALLRLLLTRLHQPARSVQPTRKAPMPRLDPDYHDPAYLAGRLFATLESIQYAVSKDTVNATFRDRYLAGAIGNPRAAIVQGQQLAAAWLKKLGRAEKTKGTAISLARQLEGLFELVDARGGVPGRIGIAEQATFILGYHHQRAHSIRAAGERSDRSRTADAVDSDQLEGPTP
jgi:CRISPR-associated protein Csd1